MEDKTSYDPSANPNPNPNSNSNSNSNNNNNNNSSNNNNNTPPTTNTNKLLAPTWLSGAAQVTENDQASNPASLHRKWCGAESGSQCVQCSFLHLNQTSASADSNPNPKSSSSPSNNPNSNPSPNPWLMQSSASPTMSMATKLPSADIVNNTATASHLHNHLQQHHHQIIPVLNSPTSNKLLTTPISSASARHGHGNLMVDLHSDTANSSDLIDAEEAAAVAAAGGHSHAGSQPSAENIHQNNNSSNHSNSNSNNNLWSSRLKADISMHPLYSQLLAAHVSCLRIATPVDQLPRIDAQIAQAPQVIAKYELLGHNTSLVGEEKEELDQFMAHYVLLLCTFKEQLQQHVKVHAMEAVMACWELEQSLLTLTGVSPGEGTGATMSDDEQMDDPSSSSAAGLMMDSDASMMFEGGGGGAFDCSLGHDSGAFGPLIPTETERTLMERVRQELKSELKNGYKERIVDVREEILRKRRAGKLPGDTTSVLKSWWHAHSKWPYPTEDEKARLVQETGLQLKQINNWFINQRKRNWHSNPSSTAALKSKRKR